MRIASADDLADAAARFADEIGRSAMTDHPTAGPSLRHYLLLTE